MKTYLILIILGFTQIAIGWDLSNVTLDDSYPVCPINLFRRKRANTEYTRWRANQETTPEFIVKVLDDELTTPSSKQIVAVNIQPVTKGDEKIIVGGVIVPPLTTPQILPEESRDYTRFVPPTTVPITRVDDELYLAPQKPPRVDILPPIRPKARHSQRDESPPASPQFLTRATGALARQYAPIAPVAFTIQSTFAPRKPTSPYIFTKNIRTTTYTTKVSPPTRTTEFIDVIWPKRTSLGSDIFKDDFTDEEITGTRTSLAHVSRTSTTQMSIDEELIMPTQTHRSFKESRRHQEEMIKQSKYLEKTEKDSDNIYNMMFYGEEDNESSNKKDEQDGFDTYEDKVKTNEDLVLTTEKELDVIDSEDKATTESTTTESEYVNEIESNLTTRNPYLRVLGANVGTTTTTTTTTTTRTTTYANNLKNEDKPRHNCSLIKLRQLTFTAPRTLAEITFQLKQWADKSPLVKWEDISNGNLTTMENPIYLMIVDDPSSGQIVSAKQTVMIVAGIQGRDHHAVAAAMYVLYQLIERSESHADLLTKYRFWIIPVFNPDGYDYSMTFPHRREWSKNLRQNWEACRNRDSCASCEKYGLRCTVQPCYGVNLDRNFEYQWIPTEELQAEHPCGALHAGTRQLSEPETRALTHFLHAKRMPLFTFIAFKEGDVLGIMYPYSHTRKFRAFDHVYVPFQDGPQTANCNRKLQATTLVSINIRYNSVRRGRTLRVASAGSNVAALGINFKDVDRNKCSLRLQFAVCGPSWKALYAGGIEDWVDGHLGIDNTYTIMMFRATDSYNTKLITERVVHEAYAAMDTLLLQSVEPLKLPAVNIKRANSSPKEHSTQLCPVIFALALCSRLPVTK